MTQTIIFSLIAGLAALRYFIGKFIKLFSSPTLKLYKNLKNKFRSGSLISRLLRPIFEIKTIKTIFGANLAAAVVTIGSFGTSLDSQTNYYSQNNQITPILEINQPILTTKKSTFQNPTKNLISISTKFFTSHPGYDFRAPLKSSVYPIKKGVVSEIVHSKYGYGRRIIIKHPNNISSLYAHLGKIMVDQGDIVDTNTKIAEVGLTGKTTGPHIHLEIYQNNQPINPGKVLDL